MKVGLQVYSIKNRLKADPYKTLEDIASVGYKAIEMANHNAYEDIGTGFGVPLDEFKKAVNSLNLTVIGAHIMPANGKVNIEPFYKDLDHFKRIIDFYAALDATTLGIPIDFFPNLDYLKQRCEVYNTLGKLCKESGIHLLYHNHWNEFALFDGVTIFDHIMNNTDPEYLGIELDAYWQIRGLYDPAKVIRKYGDRIDILHEKDFPLERIDHLNSWKNLDKTVPCNWDSFHATTCEDDFIEIGEGMIKVQDVIDAGNEFNIPYILVEQDHTKLDELDSIKLSYNNFKKMRGLEWD